MGRHHEVLVRPYEECLELSSLKRDKMQDLSRIMARDKSFRYFSALMLAFQSLHVEEGALNVHSVFS